MSDCFIGEIRMFAGNYAPQDWLMCQGQSLNVQQSAALFSLIGVTYGGDGVSTFKIPDLRGRVPIGQGTNTTTNPPLTARTIGQTGGEETHTLVAAEIPSHTHTVNVLSSLATTPTAGSNTLYAQVTPTPNNTIYGLYNNTLPPTTTPLALDVTVISFAGGNQPHANVMTTTAISFIMATTGNYPSKPN